MSAPLRAAIRRGDEEIEKRTGLLMRQLSELRVEVENLFDNVAKSGKKFDAGQRRMACRVLQLIDARLEALDRVGCHSEDNIAEELRA